MSRADSTAKWWSRPITAIANHSAVAILLNPTPTPSILMVKRAHRTGDPWSGDMAFPGGRQEHSDKSHIATALRELHEEIGVFIQSPPLMRLSTLWTKSHSSFRPMAIHPYIFKTHRKFSFKLSHEVDEAVWIPLESFETNLRNHFNWKLRFATYRMPCFYYQKYRIWGLSLKMIEEMLSLDYFASQLGK